MFKQIMKLTAIPISINNLEQQFNDYAFQRQ